MVRPRMGDAVRDAATPREARYPWVRVILLGIAGSAVLALFLAVLGLSPVAVVAVALEIGMQR